MRKRTMAMVLTLVFLVALPAAGSSPDPLPRTHGEQTGFRETASYEQTFAFIRELQRRSPLLRLERFGETAQGRPLYVVVLSSSGRFTPLGAHAGNKPVVLVSNGIHSGEICGKEASMMLMRDLVGGELEGLLEQLTLLIVPIFNADGHERASPFNRLNQNGPEGGMGHRATALGYDLNRDFMKLDTPEAQAWVGNLFNRWLPHLTIDMHTTDGWDHRYALTYLYGRHPLMPPSLERTVAGIVDRVSPGMRGTGYPIQVYGSVDKTAPGKGYTLWPPYPRLCTSYVATRGRLALLAEAHAHKTFETRVNAAYHFLRGVLLDVASHGPQVVEAVEEAEARLIAAGAVIDESDRVALAMESRPGAGSITLETYDLAVEIDSRTGLQCIEYSGTPRDHTVPLHDGIEVTESVVRPMAYIVPAEYRRQVVDRLLQHGARMERATEPFTADVERLRIEELSFDDQPYQGHLRATPVLGDVRRGIVEYPAGTFIVPMDQPCGEIIALLLEPASRDSLLSWNRMNTVTSDGKVRESWVLANLARKMMNDPDVAEAFRRQAEEDPAFLEDRRAKLNFFWERSPYPTPGVGDYPVARAMARPMVATESVNRNQ